MNTILVFDCKAQKRGWEGPAIFLNSLPINLRVYNFLSAIKSARFEKKQSIKNAKPCMCPFPNPAGLRASTGMVDLTWSFLQSTPSFPLRRLLTLFPGCLTLYLSSFTFSFRKSSCHRHFTASAQRNAASRRDGGGARKPLQAQGAQSAPKGLGAPRWG